MGAKTPDRFKEPAEIFFPFIRTKGFDAIVHGLVCCLIVFGQQGKSVFLHRNSSLI
jgi:hypothetical protein